MTFSVEGTYDSNEQYDVHTLSAVAAAPAPDAHAVGRIQRILGHFPLSAQASGRSLSARVTEGKPVAPTTTPLEMIKQIDPDHLMALDKAVVENQVEPNYLIKVQTIVGQILAQLSRIADKDRTQIDDMKTKYEKAYKTNASLLRDLGKNGLKFSVIAVAGMAAQFLFPQADREIISFLGKEGCTKLGEMFGANIQSDMKKAESLAQLILAEYSAKTSKGSSDANNKQEIIGLLEKILESLKRAAQAS